MKVNLLTYGVGGMIGALIAGTPVILLVWLTTPPLWVSAILGFVAGQLGAGFGTIVLGHRIACRVLGHQWTDDISGYTSRPDAEGLRFCWREARDIKEQTSA